MPQSQATVNRQTNYKMIKFNYLLLVLLNANQDFLNYIHRAETI